MSTAYNQVNSYVELMSEDEPGENVVNCPD